MDSWDEWVPESRVLKYNETNLQKKREVHQAHSNQQPAQRNKKSSTGSKGSGRRSDGGKEKDTDSRASTPVGSERTPGRMSRTPAGTPTPSSSEGSTEASRKKRRYKFYFLSTSLKWPHSLRWIRLRNCLFSSNDECACAYLYYSLGSNSPYYSL